MDKVVTFKIDKHTDWYEELALSLGQHTIKETINDQEQLIALLPEKMGTGGSYFLKLSNDLMFLFNNMQYKERVHVHIKNTRGEYFVLNYCISDFLNFNSKCFADCSEEIAHIRKTVVLTDAGLINEYVPKSGASAIALRIIMSRDYAKELAMSSLSNYDISLLFNEAVNTVFMQYEMDLKSEKIFSGLLQHQITERGFHIHLSAIAFRLLGAFQDVISSRRRPVLSKLSQSDLVSMEKTRLYLVDNVTEKFPGIQQLSKLACMSASKYKTLFNKIYGISPQRYYVNKKMEQAKKILSENETTINAVVHELGYHNSSAFTRQFKKYFGFLPKSVKMMR